MLFLSIAITLVALFLWGVVLAVSALIIDGDLGSLLVGLALFVFVGGGILCGAFALILHINGIAL